MMSKFVSPISFDMGAKSTGVFMFQSGEEWKDVIHSVQGHTICIEPGDITLGRKGRTIKRHQMRGYKRRKMAKRLLWVILKKHFGLEKWLGAGGDAVKEFVEFTNGLLNRRGFTYYTIEGDCSQLPPVADLKKMGFEFLDDAKDFEEQLPDLAKRQEEIYQYPAMDKKKYATRRGAGAQRLAEAGFTIDDYKDAYSIINNAITEAARDAGGHKSRAEYLENIAEDISTGWNNFPDEVRACGLTPTAFAHLVGNISNLQLRCLRKYFNVPEWKSGDEWDEPRMAHKFLRYVLGWRATRESEREDKRFVLDYLARHAGIIDPWTNIDPVKTIPPYEDQDNRHPPKCKSLLLDPVVLDAEFPGWRDWAEQVATQDFLKGFPAPCTKADNDETPQYCARLLQVVFDRTVATDCLSIRKIVFADDPLSVEDDRLTLNQRLGNADAFLKCAKRYYDECDIAAKGGWYPALPNRILRECHRNPPHKDKVSHIIVGHLLGVDLNKEDLEALKGFLSTTKVGRKLLIRIGEDITKLKKKLGVSFDEYYQASEDREANLLRDNVVRGSVVLSQFLANADKMPLDEVDIRAVDYADPYIWSQLFDVLEGDAHGFSKTCRECSADNRFRSSFFMKDHHGSDCAHAKRLPANTSKPLDGMITRYVSRLAVESARLKAGQIADEIEKSGGINPETISVPVIVEENRFEFAMDFMDFKREESYRFDKTKQKRLGEELKEQDEKWTGDFLDKQERIREDSAGICPYCGKPLDANGQIDHIVPRAFSLKRFGTIFNTEPNLIYCHAACNVKKGDAVYRLDDLASAYLMKKFGTDNRSAIAGMLQERFGELRWANRRFASSFATMSKEDRDTVRHLLFLDDCEQKRLVTSELRQQNKSSVNGTQKWLVRCFGEVLRSELRRRNIACPIEIAAYKIPAEDVSAARRSMGDLDASLVKPDNQPAYSHIVDAAAAAGIWAEGIGSGGVHRWESAEERAKWLVSVLPPQFAVLSVKREKPFNKKDVSTRSLFKDSIYGDKFLPYIVCQNGVYGFGFSPKNMATATRRMDAEGVYRLIRPFLRQEKRELPETFDELRTVVKSAGRPLMCPVVSDLARAFLQKAATEKLTGDDVPRADLLDAIHYSTLKVDVRSVLCDAASGKKLTADAISGQIAKMCTLKNVGGFSGTLIYPAKQSWDRLAKWWSGQIEDGEKVSDGDAVWTRMIKEFFPSEVRTNAHSKIRKVYSLPCLQAPSGGFRICRRTFDGGKIWQLLAAEGGAYSGFKRDESGRADFGTAVTMAALQSKNVHGLGARHIDVRGIVKMDEWRELLLTDDEREFIDAASVCPGSGGRMNVRLALRHETASRLLGMDNLKAMLKGSVKFVDGAWALFPVLKSFVGRAGAVVSVLCMTESSVVLEYVLAGAPSQLKERFNASMK